MYLVNSIYQKIGLEVSALLSYVSGSNHENDKSPSKIYNPPEYDAIINQIYRNAQEIILKRVGKEEQEYKKRKRKTAIANAQIKHPDQRKVDIKIFLEETPNSQPNLELITQSA